LSSLPEHHQVLVANCFAQSEALMRGKTLAEVESEMLALGINQDEIARLAPHKTMKGNTPSNTLLLEAMTPENLGALLALYEHKIFVQGVIWQVNSYDQWGVELGKQLGNSVLNVMNGGENCVLSASSLNLIKRFQGSK
jgi:glucose-6-phosphate isomerase